MLLFVEQEELYIGNERIMEAAGVFDQAVTIAIRPEGFVLSDDGALSCQLNRVEVMGRDVSVVCSHEFCENTDIRAIISAENHVNTTSDIVRFDIKPHKIFVFAEDTQQRLLFK